MSDISQSVYDAVRSKISNGDIGAAVERAILDSNLSHYMDMAYRAVDAAASEWSRPCRVFRARLLERPDDTPRWEAYLDGSTFRGLGNSPAEAMADFDRRWYSLNSPEAGEA